LVRVANRLASDPLDKLPSWWASIDKGIGRLQHRARLTLRCSRAGRVSRRRCTPGYNDWPETTLTRDRLSKCAD
jgi:hypothetical protein